MDVQMPDGTVIQGVPDGMSRADLVAKLQANGHDVSGLQPQQPSALDSVLDMRSPSLGGMSLRGVYNAGMGAIRGAGSIGATLLTPVDAAARALGADPNNITGIGRTDRRQAMTDATQNLGADPTSTEYKLGKLTAEGAGTAGAGGVLAGGAKMVGAAPEVVSALASNGLTTGTAAAPGLAAAAGNLALRTGAGAVAGGTQVGLVDPGSAGTGVAIGGALPGALKVVGAAGGALADKSEEFAKWLMQSALKPTLAQRSSGQADTAVQTLLDYGINPTKAGVNKLQGLISDLNDKVSGAISASDATVSKTKVLNALKGTLEKFSNQVSPTADTDAIAGAGADFMNHPSLPAGDAIPVQQAQDLKTGTYNVLRGKYGEQGSASTEAQKALARGLKDEISTAVPEVGPWNAEESRLLSTLDVTERRVLLDANKNPLGLASLAHNPAGMLAFMADRSAAFKSLAARAINSAVQNAPQLNALAGPAAFRALPRAGAQQSP
jgi:hypothetical protein